MKEDNSGLGMWEEIGGFGKEEGECGGRTEIREGGRGEGMAEESAGQEKMDIGQQLSTAPGANTDTISSEQEDTIPVFSQKHHDRRMAVQSKKEEEEGGPQQRKMMNVGVGQKEGKDNESPKGGAKEDDVTIIKTTPSLLKPKRNYFWCPVVDCTSGPVQKVTQHLQKVHKMSASESARVSKQKRRAPVEAIKLGAPNPHTRSSRMRSLAYSFARVSAKPVRKDLATHHGKGLADPTTGTSRKSATPISAPPCSPSTSASFFDDPTPPPASTSSFYPPSSATAVFYTPSSSTAGFHTPRSSTAGFRTPKVKKMLTGTPGAGRMEKIPYGAFSQCI